MPSTVSIIGASGFVGSTLASQILRGDVLAPLDRLQLVAHGTKSGSAHLLSTRIDLMDAFDDKNIDIEVVANLEDVQGDVLVICAGVSQHNGLIDRRDWGKANINLFEQIADVCAQRVPNAFFIIVSNPVELAVKVFSDRLGRGRVVGMGAEQDSLRFARGIAHDLGISRQHVTASVMGEHGQAMVPVWSSVKVNTSGAQYAAELQHMKDKSLELPLNERVAELHAEIVRLVELDQIDEAYEASRRALPDARIFLQPLITVRTVGSTPNATANSALKFLMAALSESSVMLHGQVLLLGEFLDISGVCGIPLAVNRQGWKVNRNSSITIEEECKVVQAAASIQEYLSSVLQEPKELAVPS